MSGTTKGLRVTGRYDRRNILQKTALRRSAATHPFMSYGRIV